MLTKNLFSKINNDEKRVKLMKAIDYTNIKYGRNATKYCSSWFKKKWNIKKNIHLKLIPHALNYLPDC